MKRGPLRLGVLISGGGTTLLNLQRCIEDGLVDARIDVVVSSRADVRGVERAKALNLNTIVVERNRLTPAEFQEQVTRAVADVDLVCMAGFLSLWRIPKEKAGRVINIHPALLPAFGGKGMYGLKVHEAVITAGKKESGCTIHFCDNEYDHGSIILQKKVPVLGDDEPKDLAARVFEQECVAYPEAIRLFCEDRIRLTEGRVIVAP